MLERSVNWAVAQAARFGVGRAACAVAVLVALPTLWMGLFIDDYVHLLALEGKVPGIGPLDLFQFAPGDPEVLREHMGQVPYPWFTLPELKIRFFRPLSSALMWAEHSLFGRAPFLFHVHSIAWYAALCLLAACLYRRLFPLPLALLCALLFTLDDGHAIPAGWWSNRNAVVAATAALAALLAHLRWREDGCMWALPLSLIALVLGLLGGESALGILGYLAAYELLGRSDGARRRLLALVPAGGVFCLYLILYRAGGYGVHGSGIYFDPVGETGALLQRVPERAVLLFGAQFLSLPAEAPIVAPGLRGPLIVASVASVLLLGWLLRGAWPDLRPDEKRSMRWLIAGATLAAAPVLATFPSGRLLVLPSLGAAAVIAVLLRAWWRQPRPRGPRRAATLFLLGVHLVAAPLSWWALSGAVRFVDMQSRAVLQQAMGTAIPERGYIVMVNAADPLMGMYPHILLHYMSDNAPERWWTLVMTAHDLRLHRPESTVLEIELLDGPMLQTDFEHLFRSPAYPLSAGATLDAGGMRATILEATAGKPVRIRFAIDTEVAPQVTFLTWEDGRPQQLRLPPPGGSLHLPKQAGFFDPAYLLRRFLRSPP